MTPITVILGVSLVFLVAALLLALVRLWKGPTALDRAVSLDVIAASVVAIVAILIVLKSRSDLIALLIVFVLTAFFSTVTVARFGMPSPKKQAKRHRPRPAAEKQQGVRDGDVESRGD